MAVQVRASKAADCTLAALGQEGVETVLALLRRELEVVMKQAGTTSIAKITKNYIVAHNG